MRTRIRPDGRVTRKQKPGPKPKKAQEHDDREALVVFHAFKRYRALRLILRGKGEGDGRQLARAAIAATADDVEILRDRDRKLKRIEVTRVNQSHVSVIPETLFDALAKKHRAIVRNKARKDELASLEKDARAFYLCAFPGRAACADGPVLVVPSGFLGAQTRSAKRVAQLAAAEEKRGEPPWERVARLGALFQRDADDRSPAIAQRAFAELKASGFRIERILKRLDL